MESSTFSERSINPSPIDRQLNEIERNSETFIQSKILDIFVIWMMFPIQRWHDESKSSCKRSLNEKLMGLCVSVAKSVCSMIRIHGLLIKLVVNKL